MDDPHADPQAIPEGTRDTLLGLFKNRAYGFYVGNRVTGMVGQSVQTAAVMWQVYDITGAALPLAFLGLARFVPSIAISFLAGAVADTRDRRMVLGLAQLAPLATSALLWVLTTTSTVNLTLVYLSMGLLGIAGAFEGPARASLLPQVVPRASFQRAVAVATTVQQLALVFGPATSGLLIARFGVAPTYLCHVILVLISLACLALIKVRPDTNPKAELSLALIKEGITFIRAHRAVLGAMALDMVAVIFAGADALLPIYARDILGVGAFGYGMLASAKAVGALVTATALALAPPVVGSGRTLVLMVAFYGIFTAGFGLSTWFPLSLVLYALTAAVDQVSVVMRQSIIQLGTPDALRGRVSSVNSLFVGASNQLGPVESGLVATWTGSAVIACVSGGLGCLLAMMVVLPLVRVLWSHRLEMQAPELMAKGAAR
ncbi:MAG: hypothetical protein QOF51_1195 [Chloroflexota bacterium]|jgi:MFS family permease|nr:hypothetical protein [Chloroflexota bacterium]